MLAVLWVGVGGGAGEGVTVTVEVTNTGEQAGDEVVQLYLRDMVLHAPHTRIAHLTLHALRFDGASDGILPFPAPISSPLSLRVYVRVRWLQVASTVQYDKLLKGFDRVSLAPGESTTVTFTLAADDLAVLGLHAYSADHGCVPASSCLVL